MDVAQKTVSSGPGTRSRCEAKTEIYSRVCGYFRPVANWNRGKKAEFAERRTYKVPAAEKSEGVKCTACVKM